MITVIVPTIQGRERHLQQCLASYAAHTTDYEIHVIADRPTCGQAWLDGADKAEGDYIHFSADDLQPLQGWWQAAKHVADLGRLPAPRILNGDGTLQSCGGNDQWNNPHENPTGTPVDFSRIPFFTRKQWDDFCTVGLRMFLREAHYWTDNAVSWAAGQAGYGTVVHRGYSFIHHVAQEGRGAGMPEPDRMRHDHQLFEALVTGDGVHTGDASTPTAVSSI